MALILDLNEDSILFLESLLFPLMRLQLTDRFLCKEFSSSHVIKEHMHYTQKPVTLTKMTNYLLKLIPYQPTSIKAWIQLLRLWTLLLDSFREVFTLQDQFSPSLFFNEEDHLIYPEYLKQVDKIHLEMTKILSQDHQQQQHIDQQHHPHSWLNKTLNQFKKSSQFSCII